MSDDPSATYRGFRSQALYVLHRLLNDPDRANLVFRPEGDEDLAIYDRSGILVEAVQVKDFSSPLALSNFKPGSAQGFFSRLRHRRATDPQCKTKIATFGPLGPELEGAIKNEEKPQRDVIRKIRNASDWKDTGEIAAALQDLDGNVESLDRNQLKTDIEETLKDTALGGEVEVAMDILMYWIFDASERTRDVTESLLIGKIQAVGDFLVDSRDFSSEWGTSIYAVEPEVISTQRREELVSEYRRGLDARYEHILAGADSIRSNLLAELKEVLRKYSVAIIRGASGQGKSSLAWRFLHDYCATGLRFQIRNLESRQQAMRIANALNSHVRKLRLPATVFLDVSPSAVGWPELVKEFSRSGIRAVVCVREEDFFRGGVAEFQFDYGLVSLQRIGKEEAEGIYKSLQVPGLSMPLNFEDAWTRFEESGGGPLMEFTHLITAGDSLTSRIGHQIERIRSEAESDESTISSSHLRLLALAAIANAAGAKVSYARLCNEVGLDRISDPIRSIENEYLFRMVDDDGKSMVAGLHSFRSQAIVEAFFGNDRELISDYAVKTLSIVVDSDIRSFLLYAFAEEGIAKARILSELNSLAPGSWSQVCGISEALLWCGIDDYEKANHEKLARIIQKHKRAWLFVCDISVGLNEKSNELAASLPNYAPAECELTPKGEVFHALRTWLGLAIAPENPPERHDWGLLGDLMFWAGFIEAEGSIPSALRTMEIESDGQTIELGDLGRWVIGKSEIAGEEFEAWHESISEGIRSKFLTKTHSVDLSDDGTEVAVAYALTPLEESGEHGITPMGSNLNRATMMRLNLLRLLYPRRNLFSGKAFGAAELGGAADFDESEKRIPISNLRAPLGVRMNANFRNLVSYRHERPESWKEYVDTVMAYRKAAVSFSEKLIKYWARMLSSPANRRGKISGFPTSEKAAVVRMDFPQKLPKIAVDRFGFADDNGAERFQKRNTDEEDTPGKRSAFIERFSQWMKSVSGYSSKLSAFAGHSEEISIRFRSGILDFSNPDNGVDFGHLALVCASDAWGDLAVMQDEFRLHFSSRVGGQRLKQLEHKERVALEKLWAIALTMQYHRISDRKILPGTVLTRLRTKRDRFPEALSSALSENENRQVSISKDSMQLGEDQCLVVVCDYPDFAMIEEDASILIEECAEAIQAQSWRTYEWQGVASTWPTIAFVKTVNGHAWAPLAAKISTFVLFARADGFEAKPHHRMLQEVPVDHFNLTGVPIKEHPVLRAIGEVQQSLLAFAAAVEIHMEILEYVSVKQFEDSEVERVTSGYLEEVEKARDGFADSCDYAEAMISQSGGSHRAEWLQGIEALKRACVQLVDNELFSPIPKLNSRETIESDARFLTAIEGFQCLFAEIVELLVREGAVI